MLFRSKSYISVLSNLLNPPTPSFPSGGGFTISITPSVSPEKSDIKSVVRAHLIQLRNEVRSASSTIPDEMSRYHLQDILYRIDNALDPKK